MSEIDLQSQRDGASISSMGSSASTPPPEAPGAPSGYFRRNGAPTTGPGGMSLSQRSHSAAPGDVYHSGYYRSTSPRRGSLSPPEYRGHDIGSIPPYSGVTSSSIVAPYDSGVVGSASQQQRFQSRSATATPTGSPKKRQLPKVPQTSRSAMIRDRLGQEFDERLSSGNGRFGRHRTRQPHHQPLYRSTGGGGWERHYTGLSDSDLHSMETRMRPRHSLSPDKDYMGDFGDSDIESLVSVTSSSFSTQSERLRGSRGLSEYVDPKPDGEGADGAKKEEGNPDDKVDGSLSDTAQDRKKGAADQERSPKSGSGMGKKSNSTSQLSATGRKRRMGFGKKGKSSFTVNRSEEVIPGEIRGVLSRGSSSEADGGPDGLGPNTGADSGDRFSPTMRADEQINQFVEGLGPGQLVGRQVLGAPSLGDIQLSLCYQKNCLEVEVIRARGLQQKPTSKMLPAPYVKVYLVSGKKCMDKMKTSTARRTLEPLYQQQLVFQNCNTKGCILQVTVWGDYGRIEKKVFMGVAQIMLDQIDLSNGIVIGWYKLFGTTSLMSAT
ncbi:regulating synaptic membrane exocytosis protein 2-like isoform X2 [Musca vetustissima]|uniref:regulating synaptic membrane exocytosis protein 2-like isoform X2 n=1 Tax=Musca vetustissima TaxID=27455 RepID=UPI002AB6A542|nr:regulating synaptic membrane exocytosis protein 2-like isoform X2 [Musca vetustissima]